MQLVLQENVNTQDLKPDTSKTNKGPKGQKVLAQSKEHATTVLLLMERVKMCETNCRDSRGGTMRNGLVKRR